MTETEESGERRARSKELLARVLDLPPEERDDFLEAECVADPELREVVVSLLAAHEKAGEFLGGGAAFEEDRVGAVLDRYRLVERIGEGGFGTVYAAEQTEPVRRRVALKVLKPGMDSRAVVARFAAERQTLALLDHPGIAKVLDGGTTPSGRLYFVMELVPGEAITDYCDRRELSIPERLTLFVRVCRAVQHAHQKGIIHRDLKPSNVLVSELEGEHVPKVIDFGIAKATEHGLFDESVVTEAGGIVGTPAYMAPEQATGDRIDVDSRADVYSLGCLLYELLSGHRPFEEQTQSERLESMLQRIREVDPPKPSTRAGEIGKESASIARSRRATTRSLARRLRGDLDWIVGRAIEKDRERRYGTAEALAEEVERHLSGDPIVAGPPSASYRLRKFVRRHRIGFAASVGVLLALLVGLSAALVGFNRARLAAIDAEQARAEAVEQAEVSAAALDFLNRRVLGSAAPHRLGKDVTVREALDVAIEALNEDFADRPHVRAAIESAIATTYRNLGQLDHARRHLESVETTLALEAPEDDPARRKAATDRGLLLFSEGRFREASEVFARLLEAHGEDGEEDIQFAWVLMNQGLTLSRLGRHREAQELSRRAVDLCLELVGEEARETLVAMNNLSTAYSGGGRFEEAEEWSLRELGICRRVFGEDHPDTVQSRRNLGVLYRLQGRSQEALEILLEIDRISQAGYDEGHHRRVLDSMAIAYCLYDMGRYEEMLTRSQRALEAASRSSLSAEHPDVMRIRWLQGSALLHLGRMDEAEEIAAAFLDESMGVLGESHPVTIQAMKLLAECAIQRGDLNGAEELISDVLTILQEDLQDDLDGLCDAHLLRCRVRVAARRFEEAEEDIQAAVRVFEEAPSPRFRGMIPLEAARLYEAWGRPQEFAGVQARLGISSSDPP